MSPNSDARGLMKTEDCASQDEMKFTAFSPQQASFDKLLVLSKENRSLDIVCEVYKANHDVHALCSLYSLGAPPSYLQRFFDEKKKLFDPLPGVKYEMTEKNWEEFKGKLDSYSSYLKYFDQQVSAHGHIATLKKYLPKLIPGFAAVAMHPLIHLGYAVEFNLPLVAAEGLAYASSNYYAPGEAINQVVAKEPTDVSSLQIITQFPFERSKYENAKEGISPLLTRMGGFLEKYGADLVNLCSSWACTVDNVSEKSADLALSTVKIFDGSYRQNTLDFFLLHALTGNHAARTLMRILEVEDQVRLLNLNFMALVMLYAAQGVPSIHVDSSIDMVYEGRSTSWEEIAAKASESDDEHAIKAVRNLYQLELKYGRMNGSFHRPAVRCVNDALTRGWCYFGIGFLPEN